MYLQAMLSYGFVGYLVNEVRSLKDYKVAACTDRVEVSGKQRGEGNRDVNFSRDASFNEVRKVNERERRKCSLILRGFDCNSVNEVCDKFKEVCHMLNVGAIELSDVVKIDDKKLIRAKVLNDEKRSKLLMVTGQLRNMSGFENFASFSCSGCQTLSPDMRIISLLSIMEE